MTACQFRCEHRGGYEAILHSHPRLNPAPFPSLPDMEQQLATAVPWGILPADSAPFFWGLTPEARPPTLGRPYRWGVTDCYSVARDWYARELGILIPDFPRAWGCWRDGDVFGDQLERAGFREVPRSEIEIGDGVLIALHSRFPNHCGVYTENGLMLHHPGASSPYDPTRIPRVDPISRWMPHVTRILRHD